MLFIQNAILYECTIATNSIKGHDVAIPDNALLQIEKVLRNGYYEECV